MIGFEGFRLIGDWYDPGPYRGALALPVDREGRLLLQLRDDKPGIIAPGKWGLFGGGIEPGEDPGDAVAREFEEETGLAYDKSRFRPAYVVSTGQPHFGVSQIFVVRLSDPITAIRTYEGSGFACCTMAQSQKLDLIDYLRPVLSAFWQDPPDGD